MDILVLLIIEAIAVGFALFLAGKLTTTEIGFKEAVICVAVSGVVGLIPVIGWLLSIVVYFYLLKQFTAADIWPDLILLVVVSKLIGIMIVAAFVSISV
ncbi:hypothetical protein MHM98_09810 [Psychrobium sp. MM17-31]|uniref:hypothetical protein n=1 Tax=Psychrobium sp. MM17-31 TaxID=2917758 RepID=UPI001EF44D63|nr:hypothetical protein [Psychrobium sp. MM17-31]MCG7531635.1 hypothetical protein [Psychrobium sp. MM17-31]